MQSFCLQLIQQQRPCPELQTIKTVLNDLLHPQQSLSIKSEIKYTHYKLILQFGNWQMLYFNPSSFDVVDQEYWQELERQYFLPPKLVQLSIQKLYQWCGRSEQGIETEQLGFPKYYNYESMKASKVLSKQFIASTKEYKTNRLNYKNLLLAVFIKTKLYQEGWNQSVEHQYRRFYKYYRYCEDELIIENQFLRDLQYLLEGECQDRTELDVFIESQTVKLENLQYENQLLEANLELGLYSQQAKIFKELIQFMKSIFIDKIVSMTGPHERFCELQEYPTNRKIRVYDYYRVRFESDYNKCEISIEAEVIEKIMDRETIESKLAQDNVKTGMYCHRCKQKTTDQMICRKRVAHLIPKNNSNKVECGKVFCDECFDHRYERCWWLKQKVMQIYAEESTHKVEEISANSVLPKQELIEEFKKQQPICISCEGGCQCKVCVTDLIIRGLYSSFELNGGTVQKLRETYYIFYRDKTA